MHRVLLITEDVDFLKSNHKILSDRYYGTTIVTGDSESVERISDRYHVVVIDKPGNEEKIALAIRMHPWLAESWVIACVDPDTELSHNSQFDDVICRPIQANELHMRVLRAVLKQTTLSGKPAANWQPYSEMFASLAEGVVLIDRAGHILFANPRAYEITAYRPQPSASTNLWRIVHPGDRARARESLATAQKGGSPRDLDLRLIRADRTVITCNCSFAMLADADDAIVVGFRDITHQRQTETELVNMMQFLESLIDASVAGVVATDMEGKIILYNPSAEEIHGYPRTQAVGQLSLHDLYGESATKELLARLRSEAHGGYGRLEPMRLDAITQTGDHVPVHLSASFVNEGDQPAAIVVVFTDIRAQIRAEQRLVEAQKKLEFSEQQAIIAELAATAAHELNQPLTSLMAYGEMLHRRSADSAFVHEAAPVIVQEAERMAEIVKKIGQITSYETKQYMGSQRIFDLERASHPAKASKGS